MSLAGYFIAPDAYDEQTLWRTTEGAPVAITTRRALGDMRVWDALVAAVARDSREEPA